MPVRDVPVGLGACSGKTSSMRSFVLSFLLLSTAMPAHADDTLQAQALFQRYRQLADAFDPAFADLYCDAARISNTRRFPDGTERTLELSAAQYKDLVHAAMPVARQRGDRSTFSSVAFTREGDAVRISASRYSLLKDYTSPITLKVAACNGNAWGILEEISESRP